MNEKKASKYYELKEETVNYLIETLKNKRLKNIIKSFVKNKIYNEPHFKNIYSIEFANEDVEILLDELSDDLLTRGISENSEPNKLGLKIEGIIDIFSKVFYDDN